MRLGLPALLQTLHCVDTQYRRLAQYFGFFNHGVAQLQTLRLHGLQRLGRMGNSCFPQGLQFCKGFFT